jgi:hypothetical protein
MTTITIKGWTHVHTWQEGHGEYNDYIYQRDIDPKAPWGRRVELLHVTHYLRNSSQPTGFRVDNGPHTHDYLLAREIRANKDRQYSPVGTRSISPCCTAGSDNFKDEFSGQLYRIFGAAGHGEWAFKIEAEDLR